MAAWTLGRKLITDRFTATMLLLGAVGTLLAAAPFTFPAVLLGAGLIAMRAVPQAKARSEMQATPAPLDALEVPEMSRQGGGRPTNKSHHEIDIVDQQVRGDPGWNPIGVG